MNDIEVGVLCGVLAAALKEVAKAGNINTQTAGAIIAGEQITLDELIEVGLIVARRNIKVGLIDRPVKDLH